MAAKHVPPSFFFWSAMEGDGHERKVVAAILISSFTQEESREGRAGEEGSEGKLLQDGRESKALQTFFADLKTVKKRGQFEAQILDHPAPPWGNRVKVTLNVAVFCAVSNNRKPKIVKITKHIFDRG